MQVDDVMTQKSGNKTRKITKTITKKDKGYNKLFDKKLGTQFKCRAFCDFNNLNMGDALYSHLYKVYLIS